MYFFFGSLSVGLGTGREGTTRQSRNKVSCLREAKPKIEPFCYAARNLNINV